MRHDYTAPSPAVAYTISDRKRIARDSEINAENIARQTATMREGLEFGRQIIDIWNSRLAGGREPFFSPTIRAAIAARKPYLTFYFPACHVTGRTTPPSRRRVRKILMCTRCASDLTLIIVAGLVRPEFLIEIEAIAAAAAP